VGGGASFPDVRADGTAGRKAFHRESTKNSQGPKGKGGKGGDGPGPTGGVGGDQKRARAQASNSNCNFTHEAAAFIHRGARGILAGGTFTFQAWPLSGYIADQQKRGATFIARRGGGTYSETKGGSGGGLRIRDQKGKFGLQFFRVHSGPKGRKGKGRREASFGGRSPVRPLGLGAAGKLNNFAGFAISMGGGGDPQPFTPGGRMRAGGALLPMFFLPIWHGGYKHIAGVLLGAGQPATADGRGGPGQHRRAGTGGRFRGGGPGGAGPGRFLTSGGGGEPQPQEQKKGGRDQAANRVTQKKIKSFLTCGGGGPLYCSRAEI